jgi:hypothetical protein
MIAEKANIRFVRSLSAKENNFFKTERFDFFFSAGSAA